MAEPTAVATATTVARVVQVEHTLLKLYRPCPDANILSVSDQGEWYQQLEAVKLTGAALANKEVLHGYKDKG